MLTQVDFSPNARAGCRQGGDATTWKEKWSVWQECVRENFPLTAVKIVVVVWQIVTQVCCEVIFRY